VLTHTASLIAGAIENAKLYDEARRRVAALTPLSTGAAPGEARDGLRQRRQPRPRLVHVATGGGEAARRAVEVLAPIASEHGKAPTSRGFP
jgi:hypothetical protein